MTKPMTYTNLDNCGHLTWTTGPLKEPLEVTGFVEVEIWIGSTHKDADLFCYLESVDPRTGQVE